MNRISPSGAAGITLIELMVTLAIILAVVVSAATLSVPWLARESVRGATHEVQSALQLTRIEAVKRNGTCRLVLDASSRAMQVWDAKSTSSTTDDELLQTLQLPSAISFARPDAGSAITWTELSDSVYQVVFDSDGSVSSGQGEVVMFGGGVYKRLTLFVAGGIQVQQWSGDTWES